MPHTRQGLSARLKFASKSNVSIITPTWVLGMQSFSKSFGLCKIGLPGLKPHEISVRRIGKATCNSCFNAALAAVEALRCALSYSTQGPRNTVRLCAAVQM